MTTPEGYALDMPGPNTVTILARDVIQVGCEAEALRALDGLVEDVRRQEAETISFRVLTGEQRRVVIVATYPDAAAYSRYTGGAVFSRFAAEHRRLFAAAGDKPFADVEVLASRAGFSRAEPAAVAGNRHPAVMFEVIAEHQDTLKQFYHQVFGWQYQLGTDKFAYIHFEGNVPPLLGGIGQAVPKTPGFEPGHNFYLLVDDLAAVIARAETAGGKPYMPPTDVDGYHFAMIKDPEGNPIGLITPFRN